jgi:hypothetical protein
VLVRPPSPGPFAAARAVGCRAVLLRGLLALALVVPTSAHPFTLQQLLRMPLEQLMRLEISAAAALQTESAERGRA